MKILLADDDSKIHLIMRVWLGKNAHEVTTVTNGREALALLQAGRFDGLIADVNMPLLNGKELMRQVLTLADPPGMIILLTSRCDTDRIRAEIASDRVHIYNKPFSPRALSELIEKLGRHEEILHE